MFRPILNEFKDLTGENKNKQSFIGGLIRIFKKKQSSKNLKYYKNKHGNCLKSMARTKTTVRLGRPIFVAAPGQRIGNKNILNRRNSMFKIKTLLPKTLQIEVKKMTKLCEEWTLD